MTIKGSSILVYAGKKLVQRLQNAGPTGVEIATEKVEELGNYLAVATDRGIPNITHSMESWDVSTDLEKVLTNSPDSATRFDLSEIGPINVVHQFKPGEGAKASKFDIAMGVAIPFLNTESVSYRLAVEANAAQTVGLRGDSMYYFAGAAVEEIFPGPLAAGAPLALSRAAAVYNGDTVTGARRVLSANTSDGKRLFFGPDFTEATVEGAEDDDDATTVTLTAAVPAGVDVHVVYQTPETIVLDQSVHAPASAVRPGNVKGENIEVIVNGTSITDRWSGVQNVTVNWARTLTRRTEMGNRQAVAQDPGRPTVDGSFEITPEDTADLLSKLHEITGTAPGEVVGADKAVTCTVLLKIHSPVDGTVLKSLWVPDANATIPGFAGAVGDDPINVTIPFTSQSGQLLVFAGEPTGI